MCIRYAWQATQAGCALSCHSVQLLSKLLPVIRNRHAMELMGELRTQAAGLRGCDIEGFRRCCNTCAEGHLPTLDPGFLPAFPPSHDPAPGH